MTQILLDAGHGFHTIGKQSPNGMREYEFNREVAQFAKDLLENHFHVTVHFAHSDEKDVSLADRTNKANQLDVDCYLSIHANAYGSSWNSAGGIETYIHPSKPKEATELALKVQQYLTSATGLRDRGVKTADFHVLRETKMTAILIECGFMTNPEEANRLRTAAYRRICADAIVKAVVEQYQLKRKNTSQPSTPIPELYKVQVGAFIEKQHAEALADQLKKQGYTPYIAIE